MDANYFLIESPDLLGKLRGIQPRRIHIGRGPAGWCFALMTYPEIGIRAIRDWSYRLRGKNNKIVSIHLEERPARYVSTPVSYDDMITIITCRYWPTPRDVPSNMKGPNNLLSRTLSTDGCIGYGGGTWDYMKGELDD